MRNKLVPLKNKLTNTEKEKEEKQSIMEGFFERGLWSSRYIVVLAVVFSVISAMSLFLIGSYEIVYTLIHDSPLSASHQGHSHSKLMSKIIGAIDLYLIGVVLLIFGFGIYELFISRIDVARKNTDVTILEVKNIDDLKNKIIKVIIMVLIVTFFKKVLDMNYNSPVEMMYFAVSIFALSFGVFLINRKN
ncbi:YqhA family protein [Flavobacteriales bacterium]|nr:YqhA family protein [Flavobacteriales bacterium]